jgi:uncharacterized membrane protein YphA (DoxX/SURF4 family)
MRRIEIDEQAPSAATTTGVTFLRMFVAAVVLARGVAKLLDLHALEAALSELGVASPGLIALWAVGVEFAVGVSLVFGRFTRTVAFALLCDALAAAALVYARADWLHELLELEVVTLLAGVALFFLLIGGGRFSMDYWLRRRARLQAIARDAIWSRPPYVPEHADGETTQRLKSAQASNDHGKVPRRRWFGGVGGTPD